MADDAQMTPPVAEKYRAGRSAWKETVRTLRAENSQLRKELRAALTRRNRKRRHTPPADDGGASPRLVRCPSGWLAVSGSTERVKIGVTAATEGDARQAFADTLAAWHRLLASESVAA